MTTAERVRELFSYESDTGVLRWRAHRIHKWLISKVAGKKDRDGYVMISVDGQRYQRHRLIWLYVHGEWPDGFLDHINGVPGDDRIENLRRCTRSQNGANRRRSRHSAQSLKGVTFNKKCGKYQAAICVNRTSHHLGLFSTAEQAHAAYAAAAQKFFGEYARTS